MPELDVRALAKPDKHPRIFATFGALAVGESFVLVNNHDPRHLRQEFDADHAGAFDWEYLDRGPKLWRIRIGRVATTPAPQILCNVRDLAQAAPGTDAAGALWRLPMSERQLDANVVHLQPGSQVQTHTGPDLDVLMLIVGGSGEVVGEASRAAVSDGELLWLPRRSQRSIIAGAQGLSYLTVHRRRPALSIATLGS